MVPSALAAFIALPAINALKLNVVDAGAASIPKLKPKDNKDAFFTSAPNFYGVFDGVSQGAESRQFAQTLAKGCRSALKSGAGADSWSELSRKALRQAAQDAASYDGSSTVLLLSIDLESERPQALTYAMGDSSALVLRKQADGSLACADQTCVSMHENGAPNQLGGGSYLSDDVDEDGVIESFDIGVGDYVVCFSDGVDGNIALNDVAAIVSTCAADNVDAETTAQRIVAAAKAAGRIEDDITAVVVSLGEGQWVGGDRESDPSKMGGAREVEVELSLDKPLGMMLEELTDGSKPDGVEVSDLVPDGNAELSGAVQRGDKLIRVGGRKVDSLSFDEVMEVLGGAPSPVELAVSRTVYDDDGRAQVTPLTITPSSAAPVAAPAASVPAGSGTSSSAQGETTEQMAAKAADLAADTAAKAADMAKGFAGSLFEKAKKAAQDKMSGK